MPISAIAGKAQIMDAASPGELGGTYGGAPAACCAAIEVIEKIRREGLCAGAQKTGAIMEYRLGKMKEKHDCIGDIRGKGAMLAVEFVSSKMTKQPASQLCSQVIEKALSRGVLFIKAGMYGNLIRFLPPLVINDDQVNCAMDVLDECISEAE